MHSARCPDELGANHELDDQRALLDSVDAERRVSLLRCEYAEACRQRDLVGQDKNRGCDIATIAANCLRHLIRASAWAKDSLFDRVRTIRKLQDIEPLCASADVVSFDVFDTLLYRTVEPPNYLKRLVANYAEQLYAKRGYPLTADLFLYLRNESEQRQRRVAGNRGWDTECKLSEVIYEVLYRVFGTQIAENETATLVERELEIEVQHLRVAEGVRDLLQSLRDQGKRIVVISDTYLERSHLQDIFTVLEINRYIDAIYASSEYRLGKYSGGLFQTVVVAEAIAAERLVHVGDTYESDIRGAVKAGVPAVFLFDIDRLRRRYALTKEMRHLTAENVAVQPVTRREVFSCEPLLAHVTHRPELYCIGRDILGPAFTLFVLDVIQESHRVGAVDIYYLAREGFLFRQLHETLTKYVDSLKESPPNRLHYLYVSRLATSLPAIRDLGQRELDLAFYRNRHSTLADCMVAFGLIPGDYSDLGFELGDRREATKMALFAHSVFRERVHARAEIARARLRSYLADEKFFGAEDVKLLVDIGWNATIQANVTQAFEDDSDFPLLLGCYFGRRYRHEDYLVSSRSLYMPGRFFDQKRAVVMEHAIGHCVELFELAAAAPHGATLNYQETDSGVRPVLSTIGTALSDEQKILQAGIMEYALEFAGAYPKRVIDLSVLRAQAVKRLAQLIRRPTLAQAEALRVLDHTLDWGSQNTRPLIATDIGPKLVLAPRQLFNALRESYWLEGCMRLLRIPGALTGLDLARQALRVRQALLRLHRVGQNFFRSHVSVRETTTRTN